MCIYEIEAALFKIVMLTVDQMTVIHLTEPIFRYEIHRELIPPSAAPLSSTESCEFSVFQLIVLVSSHRSHQCSQQQRAAVFRDKVLILYTIQVVTS